MIDCCSAGSSTPTCASWQSTWFHFHVYISSCPASRLWHRVAASSTVPSLCPSSSSRCLTLRTWWQRATRDMADTSPWPPCSVDACPWRRYVCLASYVYIYIHLTLVIGYSSYSKATGYSTPVGVRSIVINPSVCASVCLSVCPPAYLWNHWTYLHEILCAAALWPWLGPPPVALRYVMYFRFYGWPNVWP